VSMAFQVHSMIDEVVWSCPTNLSLWVALFCLEHHIVVRAESEMAALPLESRQVSTVCTLGTTRPFQVEPDSESNSRAKLGTGLEELAGVSVTRRSASDVTLQWNRRE